MKTKINTMTTRERIQATIDGNEVDRFPVWLKMANPTWRTMQPEAVRNMDAVELLRSAGCDPMVGNGTGVSCHAPHITKTITETDNIITTSIETPDGVLTAQDQRDPETGSTHPIDFLATDKDSLAALRWVFKDTEYSVDQEKAEAAAQQQEQFEADDVFTTTGCGPTPFMQLIEHVIGPVDTYFLLQDEPDLLKEIIELMHQDNLRMLEARLPHEPADTFWISENTSTSLLSPDVFRNYCMPYLKSYADVISSHGIIPVHHMCGTLNALLEMIDELPAPVNEAYTTGPLGDVTIAEGRKQMPSKALWGGTNATLWMAEPDKIINEVAADLENCPDRKKIFLTSAGVLPPMVTLEKARDVVKALKEL